VFVRRFVRSVKHPMDYPHGMAHLDSNGRVLIPPPVPLTGCTSISAPRTMEGPTRRIAAEKSTAVTTASPTPDRASSSQLDTMPPEEMRLQAAAPPTPAPSADVAAARSCSWVLSPQCPPADQGWDQGWVSRRAAVSESACMAASLASAARSAPLYPWHDCASSAISSPGSRIRPEVWSLQSGTRGGHGRIETMRGAERREYKIFSIGSE